MNTKIIAHRGLAENFPENTVSAFQAALNCGSDAIELDIHFTQDKQIVVHHDYYLQGLGGKLNRIYERNLVDIKQIALDKNEKIPTLKEVFEAIGNKTRYEIELKGFTLEFLKEVLKQVRKFGLEKYIEFTSPITFSLSSLLALDNTLKTGIFISPKPEWMDNDLAQTLAINKALLGHNKVIHCSLKLIDEKFVKLVHKNDLLVHAVDCNKEDELRSALNLKVDQLSTDNLMLAVKLRQEVQ